MKEHPIIFSAPMVRAILEGRKTQTRRVIKHTPPAYDRPENICKYRLSVLEPFDGKYAHFYGIVPIKFPYGQVGDRLWVRETWGIDPNDMGYDLPERKDFVLYRASWDTYGATRPFHWGWNPSIFMPRWSSRISLEIMGVRVERVQDISYDDAIAEGVDIDAYIQAAKFGHRDDGSSLITNPKTMFAGLWDSINAKRGYSWDSNPWVWVIGFRRVDGDK